MRTLLSPRHVDLARDDRHPVNFFSAMIKTIGTAMAASYIAGDTGDLWLSSVVLVGYPASWSIAWLISRK